ncbi:MAG: hypothetical protein PHV28_06060 [Kiritimatiellae bacterium]|nr:hypothetical protein [Kiritimatiellia bacterium]
MKRKLVLPGWLADIRLPFPGAAAVLTAAVIMGARCSFALSAPVPVNTSQSQNRRWETVFTNEIPLRWDWNTAAANARLEITGMSAAFSTNFTVATSNYLWRAFPAGTPPAEDVYDLTLTFYAVGGETVLGALTSRLAVVGGAFGEAGVISSPEGISWPSIRDNAVIPYDIGWAGEAAAAAQGRLVIAKDGGTPQTNALWAAGYHGWKIKRGGWGYGAFNLTLTFPGTVTNEWDAVLNRALEGFMLGVK